MRVVLDTNVIISGLMRRESPPDLLRRAWEEFRFTLVTSEWQIDELRRVSRYPRLKRHLTPHEVGRLIGQIRRRAIVFETLRTVEVSRDPDDTPLIAAAIAGQAHWLVSGDKSDLLELESVHGIKIVTARELVDVLGYQS